MILNEAIVKSKNIDNIEEYFDELQVHYRNGMTTDKDLKNISKALKKEFNLDAEVYIVENTNKFFGMRVYPSKEEIEKMTIVVVDKENEGLEFESCKEVVIEIDSQIIKMATPKEMTATLLHEVGHKAISQEDLKHIKSLVKAQLLVMGIVLIPAAIVGVMLLMISLVIFATLSKPTMLILNNKRESGADSLSVRYGYGDSLYSMLNKIQDKVTEDPDKKKRLVNYSLERSIHFGHRKNEIRKTLEDELKKTDSPYEKKFLEEQLKKVRRK